MPEHKGPTDETTQITLPSAIEQVLWTQPAAAPRAAVGLEVFTTYVGNNAEMEIELSDEGGAKHGTFKDKIHGNAFGAGIVVPEEAREALYATVKLPRHGLEMKSGPLKIIPPIEITNPAWSAPEARRGDILTLTADIKGAPDGTEAEIIIFEHDADDAHDLITQFPVLVESNKVEAEWEYEYHEDTDDIPTEEESEKGYQWPEYFFRVRIGGVFSDSELLKFKDWIEIELVDESGNPIPDKEYILHLPDGQERKGRLDEQGYVRVEEVPPGPCKIDFSGLEGISKATP